MNYIVEPQYTWLKRKISARAWDRIKAKAQWEHMTLSAVVKEYGSYFLPKRLHRMIPLCFADNRSEMYTRRVCGLKRDLRDAERQLAKERSREARS